MTDLWKDECKEQCCKDALTWLGIIKGYKLNFDHFERIIDSFRTHFVLTFTAISIKGSLTIPLKINPYDFTGRKTSADYMIPGLMENKKVKDELLVTLRVAYRISQAYKAEVAKGKI